jgi:hypothetical protein
LWRTVLPAAVTPDLAAHLERVRRLHEKDLAAGHGRVDLPGALDRKLPNAAADFCWQSVFPSATLSRDPRSGAVRRHSAPAGTVARAITAAVRRRGVGQRATRPSFRPSFATPLWVAGSDLRPVPALLGPDSWSGW